MTSKRIHSGLGGFLILILLALPVRAESQALGLSFESSVSLGGPVEAGVDAFSFYAPPGSDAGNARLEVLLHTVPAAVASAMRESGVDPVANEKANYLGLRRPASAHVKRTILGHESTGDVYPEVLGKFAMECHWIVLGDGRELLLAFRRPLTTPAQELEELCRSVCNTLRLEKKP